VQGIDDVEAFVSLLWLEADFLSQLSHQNIVGYRGVYYSAHELVFNFVLEFCEGGTLNSLMRKRGGVMSVPEMGRVLRDVLSGLAYLHEHSIIHRDIKPGNILMTRSAAKIADFGCATKALELARSCVGTPWYLAPGTLFADLSLSLSSRGLLTPLACCAEVARAEPHSYAVDIWSTGAVVLEMATGRRLFAELNAFAAIVRIGQGTPVPIPHETLDPMVSDFIGTCMQQDWRLVRSFYLSLSLSLCLIISDNVDSARLRVICCNIRLCWPVTHSRMCGRICERGSNLFVSVCARQ
jgi:mitogen-activated protein kinase kinase kinase